MSEYCLNQWEVFRPCSDKLPYYPACVYGTEYSYRIPPPQQEAVKKLRELLDKIEQERKLFKMKEKLIPDENVLRHESICNELNALYAKKNADYGDAFHLSYLEEGLAMSRIRLGDKFLRFKNLSRLGAFNREQCQVTDESIRDTLIDLANYAIMTVMELDREAKEKE